MYLNIIVITVTHITTIHSVHLNSDKPIIRPILESTLVVCVAVYKNYNNCN